MKKVIATLLASMFIVISFIGCSSDKKGNENQKNYEGMLVINEEYTVIRGDISDKTTTAAASYAKAELTKATGCEISIDTDDSEEGDPNAKEIVIGKTKRKTEFDRSTLKEGEFYIGIEGNRIIIDANDTTFLYLMVKQILSVWLTEEVGFDDGTLLMNDDICATLSAIKNPLDTSIVVMTQNLRYNNDGNGNDIVDRAPRFKAQVEKYQPDLIGVQESTAVWREILKEDYSDKYGIIGMLLSYVFYVSCAVFSKGAYRWMAIIILGISLVSAHTHGTFYMLFYVFMLIDGMVPKLSKKRLPSAEK